MRSARPSGDMAHRDPLGSAPNSPTPTPLPTPLPTPTPTPTPSPPPLLARDALATPLDPLSCLSLCFPGSVFDRLNSEGIVRPTTTLLILSLSLKLKLDLRAKRVSDVEQERDQGDVVPRCRCRGGNGGYWNVEKAKRRCRTRVRLQDTTRHGTMVRASASRVSRVVRARRRCTGWTWTGRR